MKSKSILVMRFSSIGDIIQTTSTLSTIKEYLPNYTIDYLTLDHFKPILKNHKSLNKVYSISKNAEPNKVLDERVAFIIADILKDTLYRTSLAKSFDLPINNLGGKSGTTNNSTSTWYSGFAGDMIIAVWVGKDNFSSLGDNEYGGTIALPIWLDFIKSSKDLIKDDWLDLPEGISVARINKSTGNISDTFEDSVFEYFLEENLDQLIDETSDSNLIRVFD